jgi:hypothetical protein
MKRGLGVKDFELGFRQLLGLQWSFGELVAITRTHITQRLLGVRIVACRLEESTN